MFYIIYKITNQIDGKIYIGSHKTKDLYDSYMGSGKYLKLAQLKHGIENFKKEILFIFDNSEDMYAKEAEIVNEDFLITQNTYNLKCGGFGGWDFNNTVNGQALRKESYDKWSKSGSASFVQKYESDEMFRRDHTTHLTNISSLGNDKIKELYSEGTFKGKFHSKETRDTMSVKAKQRLSDPMKNSQYGTMWITNGIDNLKIKKHEQIPPTWRAGRTIKK